MRPLLEVAATGAVWLIAFLNYIVEEAWRKKQEARQGFRFFFWREPEQIPLINQDALRRVAVGVGAYLCAIACAYAFETWMRQARRREEQLEEQEQMEQLNEEWLLYEQEQQPPQPQQPQQPQPQQGQQQPQRQQGQQQQQQPQQQPPQRLEDRQSAVARLEEERLQALRAQALQLVPPTQITRKCFICDRILKTKRGLRDHIQAVHPEAGGSSMQQDNQELRARVALLQAKADVAPPQFFCPILHDIMKDPVVTMDGHTYEREAIMTWFQQADRSPISNLRIATTLVPNIALRQQIDALNVGALPAGNSPP